MDSAYTEIEKNKNKLWLLLYKKKKSDFGELLVTVVIIKQIFI